MSVLDLMSSNPIVMPHSAEHRDLSKDIIIISTEGNWLEDALPFEVYASKSKRLRALTNRILNEVDTIIKVHSRKRYWDVVKAVLINIWNGHFRGKAVMYSRDRSYYARDSRYGKLFIKYDRLISVIDAMEALGYIEQRKGFLDRTKGLGRTTRMWATPKLWRLFQENKLKQPDFFDVVRPEKLIILRNGSKGIKYQTTPATISMWADLERYNDFQVKHKVSVHLVKTVEVSNQFLSDTLYHGLVKGVIEVESIKLFNRIGLLDYNNNYISKSISRPIVQLFSHTPYHSIETTRYNTTPYHYISTTMTQRFLPDAFIYLGFRGADKSVEIFKDYLSDLTLSISLDTVRERQKTRLKEKFPLMDIGIDSLTLCLKYEYLHRVFNRESFDFGGRAFGALHQRIPKHLREHIRIDGQPTVEIDYSAYHIRMLYHMEGINYEEDPYSACEGSEKRDIYKVVGLIAINATEGDAAFKAIRKKLEKNEIPLPVCEKPLVSLVNTFKEAHRDIVQYLFSDIGVVLQNIDSKIMNAILVRLMDNGILGLSVFDSVIVPEQHESFTKEVMIEEYKKIMGFNPRF